MTVSRQLATLCVALWLGLLVAPPLGAQTTVKADKEAKVKAAYLRYIAEFTTWPVESFGNAEAPIVLGVVGEDPHGVAAIIERAVEKKGLRAQQRQLELRRLPDSTAAGFEASLRACHLVFMSHSKKGPEEWKRLRKLLRERPIITVAEIPGFSRAAGMIEFVIDPKQSRVTMHIDLEAVQRSGLRLSSKLLGLKEGVTIVKTAPAVDACATPACRGAAPAAILGALRPQTSGSRTP